MDGIAVYSVGLVLHAVRFGDAQVVPLWINGLAPPVRAELTRRGLVLAHQLERPRASAIVSVVDVGAALANRR